MPRDVSPREFDEFERSQGESGVRAVDRDANHEARETTEQVFRTHEPTPEHPRGHRRLEIQFRHGRAILYDRDRTYELSESEIRTVVELDKFRVIATQNLAQHAYGDDQQSAGRDAGNLVRHGLVRNGFFDGPESHPRELLKLTKRGHRLLCANHLAPEGQATYSEFVKPREANHDADLYLLYQKEAAGIETLGGGNLRVILDYELKCRINREFAKFGTEARQEIAAPHGLEVVRSKIPIPDLRIEYKLRDGEMARVNLELVTEPHRGRLVADYVANFALRKNLARDPDYKKWKASQGADNTKRPAQPAGKPS